MTEGTNEKSCKHHWLIEPPSGPTSRGVCKLCGAEKEFNNATPSFFDRPLDEIRAYERKIALTTLTPSLG